MIVKEFLELMNKELSGREYADIVSFELSFANIQYQGKQVLGVSNTPVVNVIVRTETVRTDIK